MSRWWSQKFAAEGAAAADGIGKQLGRPTSDPLTILVRESAQNSWDARDGEVVDFHMDLRRIGERAPLWRNTLLPGPAPESNLDLDAVLGEDSYALVISDRGTRGLGGPLRADVRADHGVSADFVQFLRNVGEASERVHGGGTYGFGKGILYDRSRVRTILVDTNAKFDEGDGRRLMGATIATSFNGSDGARYTGRHWWGDVGADDVPDPLTGMRAELVARDLGMPGFRDGRTGTDIAILGFRPGVGGAVDGPSERTPREAATYLVSAILWNLWPKMVAGPRGELMRFRVSVDGEEIAVPDPRNVAELAPFVASLETVRGGGGTDYTRTKAPKIVGSTSVTTTGADPRNGAPVPPEVAVAMPFSGRQRHVARMRVPELVVDYYPGDEHPDPLLAYGGVFRADAATDAIFAGSEPPTHDAWVTAGLSGTDLGVVRGLKRQVDDVIRGVLPQRQAALSVQVEGLGKLANELASIIPTTVAAVSDASSGRKRAAAGGRNRRPRLVSPPALRLGPDGPRIEGMVDVPPGPRTIEVTATASVALAQGTERMEDAPLGSVGPAILGWEGPSGERVTGPSIRFAPADSGQWTVVATHVPDAAVKLALISETVDA